jgi:hypothetical protein
MPWELDYALLSFTQFKKSKYYLDEKDTIEINPSLNLSSYIVNWEKSKISKDLLISRFNQYLKLLEGYKVTPIIYEGDELYGHLDHQRDAMSSEVDFYISVCPDMYFSEHLLPLLINSSKQIDTKYFVLTPEIYKMWDNTWDEITNQDYLGVPYEEWNKGDIFDIRSNMKNSEKGVTLETTMRSKWAGWFDLFNKEMYENLVPIQKDWNGYGPWDWYSLMITEACKKNGVDFQQYILRGQTIFEYPIGPLLDGGYTKMYKDLLYLNEIPDQRKTFEFNMPQYVSDGVKRLKEKGIL